jgi:hypothetical protein
MSSQAQKKNKNRFQLYSSSSDPQPTNIDRVSTLSNLRRSTHRYDTIITTPAVTINSDDGLPDHDVEMSYDEPQPSEQPRIETQEPGGIIVEVVKTKSKRNQNSVRLLCASVLMPL